MSLFSRTPRAREVSVYVSTHSDGTRSVSIHGGTIVEVALLMDAALKHPNISAHSFPAAPASPRSAWPSPIPWYPNASVPSETY